MCELGNVDDSKKPSATYLLFRYSRSMFERTPGLRKETPQSGHQRHVGVSFHHI